MNSAILWSPSQPISNRCCLQLPLVAGNCGPMLPPFLQVLSNTWFFVVFNKLETSYKVKTNIPKSSEQPLEPVYWK